MLPVSWTTIDEINNTLYYSISQYVNGKHDNYYWILPTDLNQYNGSTLAEALMVNMNDGFYADMKTQCKFNIEYTYVDHQLNT